MKSGDTMQRLILAAVLAMSMTACTQPDKAAELLRKQGYTDIEMTGYDFFSCSEDDQYQDGFRAKTVTGETVTGTVCSGLFFKGATVRFN